ncbi:MAG: hypothetical protein PUP91_16385 [Rhizonema sp. PD37]|nr:hypothetical protein [Rhizonema sp. PD37]
MIEQRTTLWRYEIQYYQDGAQHLPFLDFFYFHDDEGSEERNEFVLDVRFKHHLLDVYKSPIEYSPSPRESIQGYVYDGVRIKRTQETEEEFKAIESKFYKPNSGCVKEIWRFNVQVWWQGLIFTDTVQTAA